MSTTPPPGDASSGEPSAAAADAPVALAMRRAPRYGRIVVLLAVAGAVAGVVLAVTGPESARYSTRATAGYLGLVGALLGGVLGGGLAVVLDRGARVPRRSAGD